jgi:putative addiction module antidote
MLRVQLRRIGNSYGIIFPADLLRYLHLKEGDALDIAADAHRIVLTPEAEEADVPGILKEILDEDREILAELADR